MATAASEVAMGPAAKSVIEVFCATANKRTTQAAARHKVAGKWVDLSWKELEARARNFGAGLIELGAQPGDRVAIIGNTRLDWIVCDIGAGFAATTAVPIYQSNLPDEIQYILENSGAVLVVAENQKQLDKLKGLRAKIPLVRKVITMDATEADPWVVSLAELEQKGAARINAQPGELDARVAATRPEDVATILYTSGTTGVPKGVILTHDNFVFGGEVLEQRDVIRQGDSLLLFLPLAHSFAQLVKASWFRLGYTLAFAESVDALINNLSEIHPTLLPAVPRIFEKVYNKVVTDGSAAPGIAGRLFRMAMSEFEKYSKAHEEKREYSSFAFSLAKRLVFPKVKAKLDARFGGKMRLFISGGAPLARKIALFFELTGFVILEGYGLTETTAVTSINLPPPGKVKVGTVGPAFPGVEVRIAADGEILLRGRNIMKGYYKLPEQTAEAIDADGWFHTGDIGEIDEDGYIRITDRKKDLLKTSNGKYIAPAALENALKANAIISQVVVIGDNRKFVSALITVAEDNARQIAKDKNLAFKDYADLVAKPEIREAVQSALDKLNAGLPSYEAIKKFAILPADFSQETGELTPSLKVKRKFANQKYKEILDGFYAGDLA